MKEKPMLFSGPMVRAILEGRKTQTRRIMKPQPPFGCSYAINGALTHAICHASNNSSVWVPPTPKSTDHRLPCPHPVGSRIWVKETFYHQPNEYLHEVSSTYPVIKAQTSYRADFSQEDAELADWKPSIYMPRWASSINLEVTEVRVERLQEISEEDAIAEGIECTEAYKFVSKGLNAKGKPIGVPSFALLWESLNGPGSWNLNPWVWVYTFRRVN